MAGHGTFGVVGGFFPLLLIRQLGGLVKGYTKETTASINSSNYFMYQWGGLCALPAPLRAPASQPSQRIVLHL
jgi:hypothetical protein